MFTALAPIWLLHVAALLSPGPNTFIVSQLAASDRQASARHAALGVAAGAAVWSILAVFGVHVVFNALPALRAGLQVAGGIYLLGVAYRLWGASGGSPQDPAPPVTPAAGFRLGFLTNITNPKSALFYGSLFAAAFPPEPGVLFQAAAVAMVVVNSFCWHTGLAIVFAHRRIRSAYSRARGTANRIASIALGAVGLGLVLAALKAAMAP